MRQERCTSELPCRARVVHKPLLSQAFDCYMMLPDSARSSSTNSKKVSTTNDKDYLKIGVIKFLPGNSRTKLLGGAVATK